MTDIEYRINKPPTHKDDLELIESLRAENASLRKAIDIYSAAIGRANNAMLALEKSIDEIGIRIEELDKRIHRIEVDADVRR